MIRSVFACALVAIAACTTDTPLAPNSTDHLMTTAATASGKGTPACAPDAKFLGLTAVSTADAPGTWWRLTKDRFDALGVTDYKAALEGFYGQSFATLDDAIAYLIDGVAAWDANGNGFVCAYEVNGTRAYLGVNALYLLGIADDKHAGG